VALEVVALEVTQELLLNLPQQLLQSHQLTSLTKPGLMHVMLQCNVVGELIIIMVRLIDLKGMSSSKRSEIGTIDVKLDTKLKVYWT